MFIYSYCLVLTSWESQRTETAGGKSFQGKFDIISRLVIQYLSLTLFISRRRLKQKKIFSQSSFGANLFINYFLTQA